MELATVHYRPAQGWSAPLPAHLDTPRTLVVAFGAHALRDDPAPFAALRAAFPRAAVVGCSTAGEIVGAHVVDGAMTVAIARFTRTPLRVATTPVHGEADSAAAGRRIAADLAPPMDDEPLRAVFLLTDGIAVNGTALVHALASALPADVILSGGMAGDAAQFAVSWVIADGRCVDKAVTAVGLYGDALEVGIGVDGGWRPFGPDRTVTRSAGNQLHELDGRPALDLYREYLGALADDLPGSGLLVPLGLTREADGLPTVVRTLTGIDADARAMRFAGEIPVGATARLMRTSTEQLVQAAGEAVARATHAAGAAPVLTLTVSCVGRRLLLGERTDEEVETVLDGLPDGSAHIGFYSNGEIATASGRPVIDVHNQTITITTYRER